MGRKFIDFSDNFTKIFILKALLVVGACIFVVDIVGRIKCPAYIGCGDTSTRNTNLVNLTTELEMSKNLLLFLFCFCTGTFHGLLKGYFNINFKLLFFYVF